MMDRTAMVLALVLKQLGGSMVIEKSTFDASKDNFEIMTHKNVDGNLLLTLIDDEETVANIRAERAADIARTEARRKIIAPR